MQDYIGNSKLGSSRIENGLVPIALSLRSDFSQLVAVFDRRLDFARRLDGGIGIAIAEAKSAAERGLSLSNTLLDLARSPAGNDN
jgi:hypothetical protein